MVIIVDLPFPVSIGGNTVIRILANSITITYVYVCFTMSAVPPFLQLEMLTFTQHQYRLVHIVHRINWHGLVTLYDRENYLCFQHFLLWGPCHPYLLNFGLPENSPDVMYKGSPLSFPFHSHWRRLGMGLRSFICGENLCRVTWEYAWWLTITTCIYIYNHVLTSAYSRPTKSFGMFGTQIPVLQGGN